MTRKHMVFALGLFYPNGEHVTSWRLPDARPERYLGFDYYRELAQTAERGRFAALFLADELYVWDRFVSGVESTINERLEPFTLLGGLSQATERLGLVATVSTTYNEPYHVARRLATLDVMSGGRAGWNLVTSASDEEAWNFGRDANLDHAVRYRRGAEFVEVVDRLVDSWDEGAVLADKASGRYADAAKVRPIHHDGEFFKVRGPLNISRPPQRRIPLFQAGASEAGKELAAATADAVFTLGSGTLDAGQDLYRDYKERVSAAGRDPDSLAVMPMLAPVIGSTEAEARERADLILELTPDQVALDLLSHRLQTDLSDHDPDELFRFDFLDESDVQQSQSAYRAIQRLVEGRTLTLRQVYQAIAGRGFLVGTPEKVADRLQERFDAKAADGFILMAPSLPSGLSDLVDHVLPLLTERGVYPAEYTGDTLHEHLAGSGAEAGAARGTATA